MTINSLSGCGVCGKLCPVVAVNKDSLKIHEEHCLRCFSCVKRYPKQARKIEYKKKLPVSGMPAMKGEAEKAGFYTVEDVDKYVKEIREEIWEKKYESND